jgi:hypothetical protein
LGIGKIIESNVEEVHRRLVIYIRLFKSSPIERNHLDEDNVHRTDLWLPSVEELRKFIGTSVNASRETAAQWNKRMLSSENIQNTVGCSKEATEMLRNDV